MSILTAFALIVTLGFAQAPAPTVWVTPNGHKYHEANCIALRRTKKPIRMTLVAAKAGGYLPCHICERGVGR